MVQGLLSRYPRRIKLIPIVIGLLAGFEAILLKFTTGSGTFCDRKDAMDMKMTGFKSVWSDGKETPCVVLFNSAWILKSRREFLIALVMILVLACLTEALGFERRLIRRAQCGRKSLTNVDRCIDSTLFSLHVTMGYLLMLCAMTYQLEFLAAVAFGLGLGHFIFHSDDDSPIRNVRADPCCAASQERPSSISEQFNNNSTWGTTSTGSFTNGGVPATASTPLLPS
uniref:Copper transport protein n=1 Tax=Aureoumbra lagunensis TaxID=44058 RepID=A0A7S3JTF2_9STRA|mmetsp:Transcript_19033/g.28767  ORF Transcript_19033/g.28767 Transcript_19033/m.28767 type:complete len:226 (+) Transcript_19033:83-760(+)